MIITMKTKTLADAETALPGFKGIWRAIKAQTGTQARCPRSITFTDVARPAHLNDGECGRRYALNLETMKLSGGLSVSSGDWAVHAGSNNDQEIRGVPANAAVVTFVWHDYYRFSALEIQVAKLPAHLAQ